MRGRGGEERRREIRKGKKGEVEVEGEGEEKEEGEGKRSIRRSIRVVMGTKGRLGVIQANISRIITR